jgi:hypothetical protein
MIRIVYIQQEKGDIEVVLCSGCFTELKRNIGKLARGGKVQPDATCDWCGRSKADTERRARGQRRAELGDLGKATRGHS